MGIADHHMQEHDSKPRDELPATEQGMNRGVRLLPGGQRCGETTAEGRIQRGGHRAR